MFDSIDSEYNHSVLPIISNEELIMDCVDGQTTNTKIYSPLSNKQTIYIKNSDEAIRFVTMCAKDEN